MKKLSALSRHLVSLPGVGRDQMEAFADLGTLKPTGQDLGHGFEVGRFQYDAVISIESFPAKIAPFLLADLLVWLDENDPDRDRLELSDPEVDVSLEDECMVFVQITVPFDEAICIVEDEDGQIEWNGQKWRLDDVPVDTARALTEWKMIMTDDILSIDTDKKSRLRLNEQLDILCMPPANRRKLLRNTAKQIKTDARTNKQGQRTVDGKPMAPGASKKKRKMFSKLTKGMITKVPNDHTAVVTWKNAGQAKVADQHHRGISERFTAKKAEKKYGVPDYNKPATPAQAKALNLEGYRRPVARKRGKGRAVLKRVPVKWIRENMTLGQAGFILRLIRTNKRRGKQQWEIKLPARPLLGATQADAESYIADMARTALGQIKRA